ncbi:MAG: GTPase HflX [Gemmatimonadota bacterium]|nr:GTPase HflX [Gemmatimonadota bacterium]
MSRELIDLTAPTERALLIGAPRKGRNARHRTAEHLEELARLADTAGADVVGEVVQQIERPNPATYLGKGKVEELTQTIADRDATLLLFDDELSPSQGKNIEDITGKRVMDRAELILDIFATRARSAEAKMQVELAQLQYMLPRLTRMWAHLEKFRGGIGVRGPGETQLETDRRLINHRIKVLGQRLTEVQKSREVQRGSRRGEFQASLVGYTNAGKSSILRSLANDNTIFVENRLFATLDPLTREVDLADGETVLLTDTVGFVRKLPHQLVASFRATLEEVLEADVLLHVIDISDPMWEEHRAVVVEVLSELGANETPIINVFNKFDLLPPEQLEAVRDRVTNLIPDAVFANTVTDDGLDALKRAMLRRLRAERRVVELKVGLGDGRLLAELHRQGDVLSQRTDGDHMIVSVRLTPEALGRLGTRAVGA